jgi:anti-sigma regulatory factor (Ser/Thr protein kinase)
MERIRQRGEEIRSYIIKCIGAGQDSISLLTARRFGISRQAVNKHLQTLIKEKIIAAEGKTRNQIYKLVPLQHWHKQYPLNSSITEDMIWLKDIFPLLGSLPKNVTSIWNYGVTEMINNSIDHSEGTQLDIHFVKTSANIQIIIHDNGIGIFRKIQKICNLADERQAVFELSKGKLTTDPKRHTGEGIFFTSRMFDDYAISSDNTFFSHDFDSAEDWLLERAKPSSGTTVFMSLSNHTARTTKKIFSQFSSGDDYGFNKTVVPVNLVRYGEENLVSRSQAKRLLIRVDRFKTVILNFEGVQSIGQAFADEIFRVFANEHPKISLCEINTSADIKKMISRARNN